MTISNESISQRLESVRKAASRTRTALLVASIVSLAFLPTVFFAYLLMDHDWLNVDRVLSIMVIKEFLVAVAIFSVSVWVYFSVRRENHLIGSLLRETAAADDTVRTRILDSVVSHMVFTAISSNDAAIGSLVESQEEKDARLTIANKNDALRLSVDILFFLPPTVFAASIVVDVLLILSGSSPYQSIDHHVLLLEIFRRGDWIQLSFILAVGGLCFWRTTRNSIKIIRWDRATGNIIREYRKLVRPGA